ncbi:hypothetical protein TNCV_2718731 [Trichonephila clavipes]|nr:hypothetical protein TNCV_2718731 [Trichonephila clavipes]
MVSSNSKTGCLCKKKSSGRPSVSEEVMERVRQSFIRSSQKSTRTWNSPEDSMEKFQVVSFAFDTTNNRGRQKLRHQVTTPKLASPLQTTIRRQRASTDLTCIYARQDFSGTRTRSHMTRHP